MSSRSLTPRPWGRWNFIRLDTSLIFKRGAIPSHVHPSTPTSDSGNGRNGGPFVGGVMNTSISSSSGQHCTPFNGALEGEDIAPSVLCCSSTTNPSWQSLPRVRKLAALCCVLNIYLLVAWVDATENPADQASRRFDDE